MNETLKHSAQDFLATPPAASHPVTDAGDKVHDAIDTAAATVKPAIDRMASGAHQAVENVAMLASDVGESLSARADTLKDLQDQLPEEIRRYIRDHPLATVGIALAAGFVISQLLRSR